MATFAQGKPVSSLTNKRTSSSSVGSGQTRICGISLPKLQQQRALKLCARPTQTVRQKRSTLVVNAGRNKEPVSLAEQFCNKFVCASSPALEPTVRTLAQDIENGVDGKRTMRVYSNEVKYKVM
jgi:hypothetical protein